MKKAFFLLLFIFLSKISAAQYGQLELLSPNDTVYVLRTPKMVLSQLRSSSDKVEKRKASYIDLVERQLEFARNGFLANKLPIIDIQSLINGIKYLSERGVDVKYYMQEYFIYYPKQRSR